MFALNFRLWDCLAIENSSVARVCVGLLIQSVHYLVHNSPSNLPRPHHAHSSSTPVASCDPNEGGAGGVSGESGGGAVEDMLLWKTIQKGLTDQHWTNKFKTGLSRLRLTVVVYSVYFSFLPLHVPSFSLSLPLSHSIYLSPLSLSLSLSLSLHS